tara:strand:- start:259 stop:693 length:435 start_codon:yes stop_codon:yes gene_type:complete
LSVNEPNNGVLSAERSENWCAFKFVESATARSVSKIFRKRDTLHKLVAEQIYMANNPSYVPTKSKWVTSIDGNVRQVMVPKKQKKWWVLLPDGKLQIAVYWKSKQIEFEEGKNAIEVDSANELVPTLESIKQSIDLGDFDVFIA